MQQNRKKRILFVCIDLNWGGAERVLATLLQHIDRTRFEPVLALFKDIRQYQIPEDIKIISLNKKGWWDYPLLIWKLSRLYISLKPDVVLSLLVYTNIISVLAKMISRIKLRLILSDHHIPSFFINQNKNLTTVFGMKLMPRLLYKRADIVICTSKGSAGEVNNMFKVPMDRIAVIYNPTDIEKVLNLSDENVEHPWFTQDIPIIISVGRLTGVKDYPRLLKAFKLIIKNHQARLIILGNGEDEDSLKGLAHNLEISEAVAFLGFQSNPFKYMSRSSVFVLSSLSEALPMVIIEAMACGVPVVSTATPGAEEIITSGTNGLLVPISDEKSLSEATINILEDTNLANNLVQSAKKRADDFSVGKIIKEYEALLVQQ